MKISTKYVVNENHSLMKFKKFEKYKDVDEEGCHIHLQKVNVDGVIALMCPNCYHIEYANIRSKNFIELDCDNANIEPYISTSYLIFHCPNCNKQDVELIELDPNIAKAIHIFNVKGYTTKFCCEGHKDSRPYIYFDNEYMDTIIHTLPLSWIIEPLDNYSLIQHRLYVKDNMVKCKGLIIRTDVAQKEEAMYDILKWAQSLPNVSEIDS